MASMDMGRDTHLDRILIGDREKRAIEISEYDPSWPARFELELRVREAGRGILARAAG